MTTKQINDEFTECSEEGYLSEYVKEHEATAKITRLIEQLYNSLTPAKKKEYEDLHTIISTLEEDITEVAESTTMQFKKRLIQQPEQVEQDSRIEAVGFTMHPAYCLNA